jgi:protein tyrosine phosphatase
MFALKPNDASLHSYDHIKRMSRPTIFGNQNRNSVFLISIQTLVRTLLEAADDMRKKMNYYIKFLLAFWISFSNLGVSADITSEEKSKPNASPKRTAYSDWEQFDDEDNILPVKRGKFDSTATENQASTHVTYGLAPTFEFYQQTESNKNKDSSITSSEIFAFLNPESESYEQKNLAIKPSSLSWLSSFPNPSWKYQYYKIDAEVWSQDMRNIIPKDQISEGFNNPRNRYPNVFAYNKNLVRNLENPIGNDYVDASLIEADILFNSDLGLPRFVACSAPVAVCDYTQNHKMTPTTKDFWYTIWQQKTSVIVNLSDFEEGGVHKSEQYWPESKGSASFGDIHISHKETKDIGNFSVHTLLLERGIEGRIVYLIHYRKWPDTFDVNSTIKTDLLSLIDVMERCVKEGIKKDLKGPVFVHCSAGIRRTGTFVATAIAKAYVEATGNMPDLPFIIGELQKMRYGLVNYTSYCTLIEQALKEYFGKQ